MVEELFDNIKEIKLDLPISPGKIPTGKSSIQSIPLVDKLSLSSDNKFEETPLARKYNVKGLNPVVINGLPLLHIVEPRKAGLSLYFKDEHSQSLRLIGLVSPYEKNGKTTLCHLKESATDGKILGGISLQVNL